MMSEEVVLMLFFVVVLLFGIKIGYELGKDITLYSVIKELRNGLVKELIEIDKKARETE